MLRAQLDTQPRTGDGGFWHKKIYPHQMWADGVYMASPFLAKYAAVFARAGGARRGGQADPARRDAPARREDGPALPRLGRAQGRALGQPEDRHVAAVLGARRRLVRDGRRRRAGRDAGGPSASAPPCWRCCSGWRPRSPPCRTRPPASGGRCWTPPARRGNYREASASAMFVYALSKGVKAGWLDAKTYGPVAARGYAGVLNQFVDEDDTGAVRLNNVCKVAGPRRQAVPRRQLRLLHRHRGGRRRSQGRRRVHPRRRGAELAMRRRLRCCCSAARAPPATPAWAPPRWPRRAPRRARGLRRARVRRRARRQDARARTRSARRSRRRPPTAAARSCSPAACS